jgi:nuclear pore complex protein Nup62
MDEILGRWASDLSKYQTDFKEQAEKVAQWDRLMVENGDKIQKLYLNTFQAEKDSAEIERQLANVESQQDELAAWLDRYEGEIDEMFTRQIGQGETLQGPDQERERTYKLAEKLTDRLDDMGKNLTSMIEAINEASTTLSKTSKTDDPVSTNWQLLVYMLLTHFSALTYRQSLE